MQTLKNALQNMANNLHGTPMDDNYAGDTPLLGWLRARFPRLLAHAGEFCDLCAGTYTLSELREWYREVREHELAEAHAAC